MIGFDDQRATNAYDPFSSMWVEVRRNMIMGEVFHHEERASREEALSMYSYWAAYIQLNESSHGSIQGGRLAEAVEIDRDCPSVLLDQIKGIQPVMTILNGHIAYSAQGKN